MPTHCRPEAYRRFVGEIRDLRVPGALLRAATAVSLHEMPDVDPDAVEEQVDRIATEVASRTGSASPRARLAHLHQVFFDEMGFRGNVEEYGDPRNSYVPWVLEHRMGLPIVLTLIYRDVAARVGLAVRGINTPGHFMALVEGDGAPMIVDPFAGGRVLDREEAFVRIEKATGLQILRTDAPFPEASPREWIRRILQNLILVFRQTNRPEDAQAMQELQAKVGAGRN